MNTLGIASLALALCSPGTLAGTQPAAEPAQESAPAKQAKPPIYDEKADAKAAVEAAVSNARKNNRRVLIQWGANWCGWCHLLHEAMGADKDLKRELLYEYDVVLVDIGRFDRNMDLAASYSADLKASGVPFLTILDSSGKVITNQETGSLESKAAGQAEHDRAAVLKFLKDHQASPRSAEAVLKDAISAAGTSGKKVFLHFGAPWCGWCHKLENWMGRPEVAAILDNAFIDVKIDVDRDTGGAEVRRAYQKEESGIPWFAFLDASGTAIITSQGPKGNTGFPAAPEEIAHFEAMLKKAGLTPQDVETLVASLRENAPTGH